MHGSSGLRERNKREKLERIEAAARALFEEQGFEKTTTREIAARAGIGTGTLFLYARDKSELLLLLFQDDVEAVVRDGFATVPEDAPLVDQLVHVFGRAFAYYAEHPALTRAFVREVFDLLGRHRERVNSLTMAFIARLAELVEKAKARGELRADAPAPAAATAFFSVYYTSLAGWLGGNLPGPDVALHGMLRPLLEMQVRGLLPSEPRSESATQPGAKRRRARAAREAGRGLHPSGGRGGAR